MADRSEEFDDLEGFFRAARAETPEPSGRLMDRILADAAAHQPRPAAHPAVRQGARAPGRRPAEARRTGRGFWQRLLPGIGGPGVVAGLACSAVAGAWIGFAQPAPIAGLASQMTGQTASLDQVDLIPAMDSYLTADAGD
ncbi:dihydroorotate dehydrogenase [Acidimangrovimonas sediminis]|uniref:dihydroorotate dehydrogenase n=1 Tax=Acidimangrovimonas sediminis TaxID=2056283 RepID=UPI000C806D90|nr:dihydroorotate dehydrogenase [Acidimangrovimonas sediminis]